MHAEMSSDHEGSNPGCIGIPLAAIFGYVVGYIVAHLLEKFWSILLARILETRLETRTLCNGNEEGKAWDLLLHGRGYLGVLL
jgi:hypothetical protein